ncbi:glycosyl transferase family 90-domain-containing protein [Mycena albidolilacea]|uniref:Glycosyl transferase family 90-domain-containing protein n=1 Tax=Mycena albidolilacea TaxID=1033008 RepID=A0AAD7A1Z4_9AGAR|nr:glycosyl transferase family 90-domain-containing protein [Mycena albidolilacea]
MSPSSFTVLRRRSLRRPAVILLVIFAILFLGQSTLRDLGFDAQHSTRIAFKYAAGAGGRGAETVTRMVWATRTVTRDPLPTRLPPPQPKRKSNLPKNMPNAKDESHTYHPSGLLLVNPRAAHPIPALIRTAEAAWALKLARASTTLRQAAAEYTRRHGRLPPRGFDAWWGYVRARQVRLPDEYDQIERDLGPFYGVRGGELRAVQRGWEAHVDSYTLGKDMADGRDAYGEAYADEESESLDTDTDADGARKDRLRMLNFTLPADPAVRLELATGGFQLIELLREVEAELPPFRAVFSPHDNPNVGLDYELRQQALEAARKGTYIDTTHPPPQKHAGWLSACPPFSRAWRDFNDGKTPPPPKSFVHDALLAADPCHHPTLLRSHGAYLAHGAGPAPYRTLVPQFSYSVTPLHADVRVALPLNWVPDGIPNEGRPPPLGLAWAERVDARLQWRGSNTGIWHASDGRWREAHRIRLAALGAGVGSVNVSVLDPGEDGRGARPVGPALPVLRARLVPVLFDVAFAGNPMNCEPAQCDVLERMFEWRKGHDLKTAARYKYVIDVDGNGWSSRFKRLMNSGSLIFKATTYPEWFTDRLAPWVHYVPIQNSYTDLMDALVFFRAHDKAAARIAAAGREWSRRYWRREDMVAYMYRLFLEYARVMSTDRDAMSFEMWPDEREDAARERALMARWDRKGEEQEDE